MRVRRWVSLYINSLNALFSNNMEFGIFPIYFLAPHTLLGLVREFKLWASKCPIDRLWYHIRVWSNSSIQNWLVRLGVSVYINYFNVPSPTNVEVGIFPIHRPTPFFTNFIGISWFPLRSRCFRVTRHVLHLTSPAYQKLSHLTSRF